MMSGGGGGGDTPTKKIAKSENEGQECFETPFEVHSNHIVFAHAYIKCTIPLFCQYV